ncbi:fatty acid--CoA ligase family protein [Rhodococcus sp. IEGM 1366]|uniref:class I adenylate-forming enzyme family protein n=1 Tax=Rhodococcus sp. IEGM 1366 TaxID=3082223 RepID=UPI002954D565|nr:fatty acid--CoA ligase family protein [Rhodococcus sp. IEGM 1366]MDV8071370.1 fatty acid--CoA ligase family protein [Rhodococcus sp. IEGM 1366]
MSIRLLLDMSAQAYPDRIALGAREGGVTFADLAGVADVGSRVLGRYGARTVAFVGVNSPVVPQLLFASATAGVPFAPLNYRLSSTVLRELIGRLDRPLVVADPEYVDIVRGTADVVLTTGQWAESVTAEAVGNLEIEGNVERDDDSPAILLFTSGTTAAPKCVVLRHRHLLSYVLGTVAFGSAEETACALLSVPPYHIAGMGAVLTNTYSARRVAYLPDFKPTGWLELVRAEQVTHAMVVPTMLARVMEHLDGTDANCPSLVSMAYGGARMPLPVLTRALKAFSTTGFVNAYGLTETSSTISVLGPDEHRQAVAHGPIGRLASVGRVVPGMEAQVRSEDGDVLPAEATGELWVRGAQVSGEYAGIGSVLDPDGWFPTRDRARFDEDGYLYLDGRSDDTIIRGGENISPAEVEDVLLDHPAVREVAVVGVPDSDWGERLSAVVVLHDSVTVTAEELRSHVRSQLRGSRTPDDVEFRTELPYTPTGKLLRRTLVAQLVAAAAS